MEEEDLIKDWQKLSSLPPSELNLTPIRSKRSPSTLQSNDTPKKSKFNDDSIFDSSIPMVTSSTVLAEVGQQPRLSL